MDISSIPRAERRTVRAALARLAEIDAEIIRPLRTIAAGFGTDEDRERVLSLEAEARVLRAVVARTSPPAAPTIPTSVSRRQARRALLSVGLLDAVEAAIASLPVAQRAVARIEWDDSQEVHRDNPFTIQLAVLIGLDEAAVDQLFITASEL